MKTDVFIIDNPLSKELNKAGLESFCQNAQEILGRGDYDFIKINEVALFVVCNPQGNNTVTPKSKETFSQEEEVGISLMRSRLNHLVENSLIDSKFLGVNANLYLALNSTEALKQQLTQTAQNDAQPLKQQQANTSDLNLRLEEPRYTMDQIELNKKTKEALHETITLAQKQALIYEDWGFKEVDKVAKTIINFHGKPGTGKTMSAHIIAHELGKKIIHGSYADIESKFVGDAPKNLVKAFDLAQEQDAILFFDEADSFLGKRISNVSQSSDQALNSLRSELLKFLEERAVIVIFATNLLDNYDKAFHSRILRSVPFDLPNKKQRRSMILKHIPKKLYEQGFQELDIIQLETLTNITEGFSGREIKNAVLNSLIAAAKEDSVPNFEHFKKAFKTQRKEFKRIHQQGEKNEALGKTIKKNLKTGNYKRSKKI